MKIAVFAQKGDSIEIMIVAVFTTWIVVRIAANVHAEMIITPFTGDPLLGNRKLGQTPGAIEGDIISSPQLKARGLVRSDAGARWQNGIVPYEFSPGYTTEQQTDIITRMRKLENLVAINNVRCIQFRPKVPEDVYYITIQNGTGCRSTIGKTKGYVILQYPDCFDDGVTFHELLHTLGLYHEQSRFDRNSYVRVYEQNIRNGSESDFQISGNPITDTFNTAYDYSSIMHYGKYAFSKNGLPTIEPIQPNIKIGQSYNLSSSDIQLVRRYYNCSATGPNLPPVTIPIKPAIANMLIVSTYSSELTNQNLKYARNGTSSSNFYFEAIQINILNSGLYAFQCYGNIDTFAYIYTQTFDPLNPAANLRNTIDDRSTSNWEFGFMLNASIPQTFILVVTTYNPNITGPFFIVVSGYTNVTITRIKAAVPPTNVTTTTTTTTTKNSFHFGRWSATGSLAIGRITHTSTLLADGRVITTGGNEGGSSAEFYSPATGTWTQGPSMIDARSCHTSTLLPDGRLFVTGGWYYNTNIRTAEIYNPATNNWTAVGNMNIGRYGHQAIYLPAPTNKILVMGGFGNDYSFLRTCELYDFATNQWTWTTPMISGRIYFTATYLPSLGKVVVIGGSTYPDKSAEMFTPSSLQWTRSINEMADSSYSHTATLLPNGHVLIAGISYYDKRTYLFNPTTNSFTFAANITHGRMDASATLLPSGLVLLTGGLDNGYSISRTAEVYDYNLDVWRSVANMNTSRFRHTLVSLKNSSSQSPTALIIGGQKELSQSITSCELFSVND